MRGLKYDDTDSGITEGAVALLVSAWIEIESIERNVDGFYVALLVSAWIEMIS